MVVIAIADEGAVLVPVAGGELDIGYGNLSVLVRVARGVVGGLDATGSVMAGNGISPELLGGLDIEAGPGTQGPARGAAAAVEASSPKIRVSASSLRVFTSVLLAQV